MKEPIIHRHEFGRPQVVRITRIENLHYHGTSGDKAFLMHRCKCSKVEAFDYGDNSKMQAKLKELLDIKEQEKAVK